jgi:hypothetical protein
MGCQKLSDMERALKAVQGSDVDLNTATYEYPVRTATLKRHLHENNYFAVENTKMTGNVGDIPPHFKEELLNHFLQLGQYMFHIAITDLLRLAFLVAELNYFPGKFNKNKQVTR